MDEQQILSVLHRGKADAHFEPLLADFLWAQGYFDFWDIYLSALPLERIQFSDEKASQPLIEGLAIAPLRSLISKAFRQITHWYEVPLANDRDFFLCAFERMAVLMSERPTVEELYHSNCGQIPDSAGIYRIVAPEGMQIRFLDTATNTAAPLYLAEDLRNRYEKCRNRSILYIGKAGGKRGLRQRLRQYMNYGWNQASNHKGGRAIWQMEHAGQLLVEYECCENCAEREHQLLKLFREKNGAYPVANHKG